VRCAALRCIVRLAVPQAVICVGCVHGFCVHADSADNAVAGLRRLLLMLHLRTARSYCHRHVKCASITAACPALWCCHAGDAGAAAGLRQRV
jgi:hypothetical protein